jgi:hypothetical protein
MILYSEKIVLFTFGATPIIRNFTQKIIFQSFWIFYLRCPAFTFREGGNNNNNNKSIVKTENFAINKKHRQIMNRFIRMT